MVRRKSATPLLPFQTQPLPLPPFLTRSNTLTSVLFFKSTMFTAVGVCSPLILFIYTRVYTPAESLDVRRGQGMGQTDIALSLTTPGHPRYFALRLSYPLSRPFRRPRRGRSSHSGGQPAPR